VATLPVVRLSLVYSVSALILFACGLVLASCGGGDDESSATTIPATITDTTTTDTTTTDTTTTAESSTTTAESSTTTETTPPKPEGPTVIRITVENAAPKGGIVRKTVQKGDRVVLVVTADVTDHIHLHGYDIMRDVAPGRPARLPFKATVPGRFEVELEDRGVPIADITVKT